MAHLGMSLRLPEIRYGGSIYTKEIGKGNKIRCLPLPHEFLKYLQYTTVEDTLFKDVKN